MSPTLTGEYSADMARGNREHQGKPLASNALLPQETHKDNIGLLQLGLGMRAPADDQFWVLDEVVILSPGRIEPAFFSGVYCVVGIIPKKQMVESNARLEVAVVANEKPSRILPCVKEPRHASGYERFPMSDGSRSVAITEYGASPRPTSVKVAFVDPLPEFPNVPIRDLRDRPKIDSSHCVSPERGGGARSGVRASLRAVHKDSIYGEGN